MGSRAMMLRPLPLCPVIPGCPGCPILCSDWREPGTKAPDSDGCPAEAKATLVDGSEATRRATSAPWNAPTKAPTDWRGGVIASPRMSATGQVSRCRPRVASTALTVGATCSRSPIKGAAARVSMDGTVAPGVSASCPDVAPAKRRCGDAASCHVSASDVDDSALPAPAPNCAPCRVAPGTPAACCPACKDSRAHRARSAAASAVRPAVDE